jgi:hypothetical protein
VSGDYLAILNASLDDADKMYHNDGAALKAKYPSFESKDDRQACTTGTRSCPVSTRN